VSYDTIDLSTQTQITPLPPDMNAFYEDEWPRDDCN